MEKVLDLSAKLFNKLNESNISYCHWKSNEHLLPGLNGETDLDVLVKHDDKEKFHRILKELSFICCNGAYGGVYNGVEDWIGLDIDTGTMIHIHLHFRLVTGHKGMKEYSLPWTDMTLDTRVIDDRYQVYIMEPSLELITLYARICLKTTIPKANKLRFGAKFHFKKDDKLEIEYLKKNISNEKLRAITRNLFKNPEIIVTYILKNELSAKEFLHLRSIFIKELADSRDTNAVISIIRELYYWFTLNGRAAIRKYFNILIIRRKTPGNGCGRLVAFVGQDGSGKSTVTKDIIKWLSWKLDVEYFYLGSGEQYKSIYKSINNKIKKYRKNTLVNNFVGILTVLDCVKIAKTHYCKLKVAQKYCNNGGIALMDRLPQIIVSGYNDGPCIRSIIMPQISSSLLKRIIEIFAVKEEKYTKKAICIQPDLVFKLLLSPEESIKRKPGEAYDTIIKKHDFIKTWNVGKTCVEIDASQSYSAELIEIKELIWRCLTEPQ